MVVRLENTNRQVAASGVPAPVTYGTEIHGNQTGIVMEHIEGGTLMELIVVRPDETSAIGAQLAKLHLDIHSHIIPGLGDKLTRVKQQVADVAGVADEIKARCLEFLSGPHPPDVLVHGDLHPANVMLTADGDYIGIDWDFATRGPAGFDVARAYLLLKSWALAPGDFDSDAVEAVRVDLADAYLAAYLDGSDLTMADVEAWLLPVSVDRLREPIPEEEELVRADVERLANK